MNVYMCVCPNLTQVKLKQERKKDREILNYKTQEYANGESGETRQTRHDQ